MMIRGFQSVSWQSLWVCSILGLVLPWVVSPVQAVVITEFLAHNDSGALEDEGELLDEDGDASDWIELYNPTHESVNLAGWTLTDDPDDLTQWTFPQVHLMPGRFLVVFASGKDRTNRTSTLHTNFQLSRAGGFLALVQPDGQTVNTEFDYPKQRRNVSYGVAEVESAQGEILVPQGVEAAVGLPSTNLTEKNWVNSDYDDSAWLTGSTAVGYGYEDLISLDMGVIRHFFTGLYLRIPFDVSDRTELVRLVLRMKYDDGFAAYLNGVPVARANVSDFDDLAWDSQALSLHEYARAEMFEDFVLPETALDAVVTGRNVLAIHGLNVNADSVNLLVLPELWAQRAEDLGPEGPRHGYMSKPTPGGVNAVGVLDFVQDVQFSEAHGFYEDSFSLALTSETLSADIRYTLDGSTPTEEHGLQYQGPLTIDRTTVIRAAAFKPGALDSQCRTQTYFFVQDILEQSPTGQAPGPGWPTGNVNGQSIDYGMDPDIVTHARWAGLMTAALLDVPSISLVTDIDNLFGRSQGIYVNARRDGLAWERRTSVELIHPDGTEGFDVEAGLRIRGAFSRTNNNPKHSFRLFFRSEYGTGKLRYPLFGGEGTQSFDKIDLRTSQNNSWAFQNSAQNTMIRDVFSRDVQRDMGQPYTRSRYYHLYLNGHYWGLYQTEERADADFAESYLGARAQDYDVVKNDSSGSRALHATAGTIDAYRRLYDAAVAGFGTDAAYLAVQGLLSDGSPDPTGERLLDPENLMDYMICTYYTGDPDAPVSCWAHFSNNVFAIYNHTEPQGFTWYRHDAEHSLGANGGLTEGRLLTDSVDRTIGSQWRHFNPAWLHVRLCDNPDYRRAFADRVAGYFANDGLLTAAPNIARWMARAEQIDLAIIAESARWGDAKRGSPFTRDHWQGQTDYMVNDYFPNRTPIVINQMRSVNMFPDQALVSFNQSGGGITPGFQLLMSQANGTSGTIYYTLDGTDPRAADGTIHPDAAIFTDETTGVTLVERGANWRYLDNGSDQGTAWRALNFNDHAWKSGPAPLGYGDGDEATVVGFGPSSSNKFPTTYFRHSTEVQDPGTLTQLTLSIMRDDGAIVTINGEEAVPRINMPSGDVNYLTWAAGAGVPVGGAAESTYYTYDVDPDLLVAGTNVVAVEIHQVSGTSSDISFDLELVGLKASTASPAIILNDTTTVKARVYSNAAWGALAQARFTVGLGDLVINEFMAVNRTTLEDPAEVGEYPDWIELYNGSSLTLDLGGMFLTDDSGNLTKWQIAFGTSLDPGQYLVLYADDDAAQGPDHTSFKLDSNGETLTLVGSDGVTVFDSITYDVQVEDVSYGRFPDGSDTWDFHTEPTPGAANVEPSLGE